MRILVTESEFVWRDGRGKAHKATLLHPPENCIFENIELMRDGAVHDTGAVRHIPEAGHDGFDGFEVLFGERQTFKTLEPSQFQPGDQIVIDLLRANIPEADYWKGLTAGAKNA